MSEDAAAEQLLQMLIADRRARVGTVGAQRFGGRLAAKVTVCEVLEAITRRARALLDAHASCLTLLEEVGDLSGAFTRVTSGIAGDDPSSCGRGVPHSATPRPAADLVALDRPRDDRWPATRIQHGSRARDPRRDGDGEQRDRVLVWSAYRNLDMALLFGLVFLVSLVAIAVNLALYYLEKRLRGGLTLIT